MAYWILGLNVFAGFLNVLCVCLFFLIGDFINIKSRPVSYWLLVFFGFTGASLGAASLLLTRDELFYLILGYIANFIVNLSFLFFIFDRKAYKFIIYFSALYKILSSIVIQSGFYFVNLKINAEDLHSRIIKLLVEIAFGLAAVLVICLIRFKKIFKNFNNQYFTLSNRIYLVIITTLSFAALLEYIICNENLSDPRIEEILSVVAIVSLNLILLLIIFLFIIHNSQSYYYNLAGRLKNQIEIQMAHYNELNKREEAAAVFRHDHKNLVLCLRALLEAGEVGDALEYLEKLEGLASIKRKDVDSGNYIADALINEKIQRAAAANTDIVFGGFIPSNRIDNFDVCIILGNSLDNAVEACEKIEGKKTISIESDIRNNLWLLCVKNPVADKVRIRNNSISTSKSDKSLHGFGLYSVRNAVKKNEGRLTLKCSDGVFCFESAVLLKE